MLKPRLVAHAFNPTIWEAEAGRCLWVQRQPGLQSDFQDSWCYRETLSPKDQKKKKNNNNNNNNKINKIKSWNSAMIYQGILGCVWTNKVWNNQNFLQNCIHNNLPVHDLEIWRFRAEIHMEQLIYLFIYLFTQNFWEKKKSADWKAST